MTYFVMKNKVPGCVINIMLIVIHYIEIRHAILCNTAKTVHMEKVVFILYRNEKSILMQKRRFVKYISEESQIV